jgi:predicted O-methyltransferase YrrM
MNQQKKIHAYCEAHTTLPLPILHELERATHLRTLSPQMLSGRAQGQLLRLLTALAKPTHALEIGTFTGYASLCIASGLPKGGMLHTIEVNPELAHISNSFFEKAGLAHKITAHIGDARAIIPTLDLRFGLAFIDAAKFDYPLYFEMVIEKMEPGGLLIADNVLWDGKVTTPSPDADTRKLMEFNRLVHEDPRVENLLLPLRDGVLVARKV